MGMGSNADKFSTSSSMSSEDVMVVDSNRPGLCVVGVDLEGPAVDVFINLKGKASMRDERDCSNLCVISISATRRQGGLARSNERVHMSEEPRIAKQLNKVASKGRTRGGGRDLEDKNHPVLVEGVASTVQRIILPVLDLLKDLPRFL
ncbi:hypothetical protein LWI29_022020 [Acer saccharum]|uniref:Uncharacterized protein n=1 Tax=Acer saccharum TaxID=4024 RepID=A0AA39RE58_ACESA|nr:hypothetical protein LWI29_022020 [Acer saccharum]